MPAGGGELRLYCHWRGFGRLCCRCSAQRIRGNTGYSCWKPAAGTAILGSTSRWASPGFTPIRASIGCTRASPRRSSAAADCISRAARCSAAQVQSMAWCICEGMPPTMTNGDSEAAPAGIGTACCPTSRRRNTRSAAPTSSTAPAARCMSLISRTVRNSRIDWWRLQSRRGCRRSKTSMTDARKGLDISRAPQASTAAGAPRRRICARRADAATWWCAQTRMPPAF